MTTQEKNSVRAKKTFKTEEAENFIREYKQKRWVYNSERIGKPDSLSAWYSNEQLQTLIDLSKSHGGNGIRFFYGTYPENYPDKPEYAARQTLIMVPTKSKILDDGHIIDKNIYTYNHGRIEILGIGSSGHPSTCPPICPIPDGGMGDLGITIVDRGVKGMEII